MTQYTALRNINRGYMKLDVWRKAIELHTLVWKMVTEAKIDFKLRAQLADAAQSVSANIAEGYSRRSLNEYVQYLYISLGSLSETFTRVVGLKVTGQIDDHQFQQVDTIHYEIENKLIRLIESLEKKRGKGTWIDRISVSNGGHRPL